VTETFGNRNTTNVRLNDRFLAKKIKNSSECSFYSPCWDSDRIVELNYKSKKEEDLHVI